MRTSESQPTSETARGLCVFIAVACVAARTRADDEKASKSAHAPIVAPVDPDVRASSVAGDVHGRRTEASKQASAPEARDDRLIVCGKLPPIAEGAQEVPHGLLIGLPNGFTFEYTLDDVRLLGVRMGGLVDRNDRLGSGEIALEPPGKLMFLCGDGAPGATFERTHPWTGQWTPLAAHLTSSVVLENPGCALVWSRLVLSDDRVLHVGPTRVGEAVAVGGTPLGWMFQRNFDLETRVPRRSERPEFRVRCVEAKDARVVSKSGGWLVLKTGAYSFLAVRAHDRERSPLTVVVDGSSTWATLRLSYALMCPGPVPTEFDGWDELGGDVTISLLPLSRWDSGVEARLAEITPW